MQAILKRFREGEVKLFEKHGMKVVGVWTSLVGGESDVLYYMVGYKDLADRDRCWQNSEMILSGKSCDRNLRKRDP